MNNILDIFRQYGVPFNDPCNEDYLGVCHCPNELINLNTFTLTDPLNIGGTVYSTGTLLIDILNNLSGGSSDADWYQSGLMSSPMDIDDSIYTNGRVGINIQNPLASLDILDGGNTAFRWNRGTDRLLQINTIGAGEPARFWMYDNDQLKIQLQPGTTNYFRDITSFQLGDSLSAPLNGVDYLLSVDGNIYFSGEIVDYTQNVGTVGQYLTPNGLGQNIWNDIPIISAENGVSYTGVYKLGGVLEEFTYIDNPDQILVIGNNINPIHSNITMNAATNLTTINSSDSISGMSSFALIRSEFISISSQDTTNTSSVVVSGTSVQITGLPEYPDEASAVADINLLIDSLYRVTGDSNLKIK